MSMMQFMFKAGATTITAIALLSTTAISFTASAQEAGTTEGAKPSLNDIITVSDIPTISTEVRMPESDQVTSISQLSDVKPTDWAFQALQSLVERYGCIVGYPDRTFRGNRAISRYEFAAGLNACMDRVNELIAAATADLVRKEDLATFQKLLEEFAAELAVLRGRVDSLDARISTLESQQFSTTTKLNAEVIFALAQVFGDQQADRDSNPNNNPDLRDETIFADRVRLNFDTSFTGKDRLRTRIQFRNLTSFNTAVTGTNMTRLSFDGNEGNSGGIDYIFYRFPISDSTRVIISAVGTEYSDILYTINPFLEGSGDGSISRFGRYSNIYRGNGSGAVLIHKFSPQLELTLGYLAESANLPTNKNGLFDGNHSALAQVLFSPAKNMDIGLIYAHSYYAGGSNNGVNLTQSTGSLVARRPFGNVSTSQDAFQLGTSLRLTPGITLSGWFEYAFARSEVSDDDADILNFSVNLAFPDLGRKGNLGALIFGIPGKVVRNTIDANEDPDTSFHIEALYRYQINKNIAITPGIIVITNPEHNNNNDTIFVGTVRTTFRF
jgi:hypothetical protein